MIKEKEEENIVYSTSDENNNNSINLEELEEALNNGEDLEEPQENIKHFELVEQIINTSQSLNDLDEYLSSISDRQSQNDLYISDLLHFVENYTFTPKQAQKFVNILKEKRIERRKLNCDWEIKKVYDNGRQRFGYENQRDIFMAGIYKKEKELSYPYNYRVVTPEEIEKLIK